MNHFDYQAFIGIFILGGAIFLFIRKLIKEFKEKNSSCDGCDGHCAAQTLNDLSAIKPIEKTNPSEPNR